jgi:hypothetical protein
VRPNRKKANQEELGITDSEMEQMGDREQWPQRFPRMKRRNIRYLKLPADKIGKDLPGKDCGQPRVANLVDSVRYE